MLRIVETGEGREGSEGATTLDDLALEGARRMLAAALEEEVAAYIGRHHITDDRHRARIHTLRPG